MPREKNQKIKIIRINDILRNARGEEKAIYTVEFTAMLEDEGISCDRRTLADNIAELMKYVNDNPEYDYRIVEMMRAHGKCYFSESKQDSAPNGFSYEELKCLINGINSLRLTDPAASEASGDLKKKLISLAPSDMQARLDQYAEDENDSLIDTVAARMLIDSISSFTFISKANADKLSETVIRLADPDDREELIREKENSLYCRNTDKGISFYEFDTINRALSDNKKLVFKYYSFDENQSMVYHKNGEDIIVEPVHLIQSDDNYYLVCYSQETESGTKTYRIDRMIAVRSLNDKISEKAMNAKNDDTDYARRVFRMYSGPKQDVTFRFDDSLIGHIFDKFGSDVVITRDDNGVCTTTQTIQVSPPFWGWLFQFGKKISIAYPQELAQEYREKCRELSEE